MFKILAGIFIMYTSANSYMAGESVVGQVGVIAGIALIGAGLDTIVSDVLFNKK